jgi:eukaryotic-like serine/threonine-protein kinase
MSDPNQDRLCLLLHSYELGLLEGDQLDEFEQHLLDCPTCLKQAEEFLPAAHLLKHDLEIRGLIEGLQSPAEEPKHRSFWPAVLAIAAAVIILVLRPWHLEFHPTQEVTASENRLAIVYVGNESESEEAASLGPTAVNLLIADLSESQFLRVVSTQRLYDAALHLGLPDANRVDQSHAGALAREVGAKWMLTANIVADTRQQRLITQLFDVASGDIEATQTVVMDSSVSVFDLVDQLSIQLKTDLGLPAQALKEADPKVADVTSHSVEAYQIYLKGIEFSQMLFTEKATECFHKAAMLDSSFAMAYYYLSLNQNPAIIEKAVAYSSRATKKEQMFIAARAAQVARDTVQTLAILQSITEQYPDEKDAFYQLGQYYFGRLDYSRAVFYLEKSLALDPLNRVSYNQLAYCYDEMGQLDEALRTLDEYQKIAPDEPNPLDSRGDILARNGRLTEAIAAYTEATKKEPGFSPSKIKLYYAYITDGQYEQADEIYRDWESKCVEYGCANTYWAQASTLAFRGRYRESLTWLDKAIDEDGKTAAKWGYGIGDALCNAKAQTLMAIDSPAVAEMYTAIKCFIKIRPDDKVSYRASLVRALAQAGQIDSAAQVLEQLRKNLEERNSSRYTYWIAGGYFELERNEYAKAAESFDSAATLRTKSTAYSARYIQGQALVMAGQYKKAIEVLATQEKSYTESRTKDFTSSKLYYYLARAYEASGQADSAITKYEKFLTIWTNADPDLPEYTDAHTRLARLKTNP